MFAVVNIQGQQFKVKEKEIHYVPKLIAEPNSEVTFEKTLLISDNNKTIIGSPYVNAKVVAKVIEHMKDDKVLVFKKKRRNSYKKLRGHRQQLTKIQVLEIKQGA